MDNPVPYGCTFEDDILESYSAKDYRIRALKADIKFLHFHFSDVYFLGYGKSDAFVASSHHTDEADANSAGLVYSMSSKTSVATDYGDIGLHVSSF